MQRFILLFALAIMLSTSFSVAGGYEVGDQAANFSLMNVDGSMVSLSDFPDAKGFIVVFTCNHCPYSVAYEDRLIDLDRKYKSLGFPVIAINPNDPAIQAADSFENMQERAQEKGFTFPYLLDDGQKVYPQYGATRTPHIYLLQKNGSEFIVRYIGAIDDNHEDADAVEKHYLASAVDALLSGDEPSPTTTKAVGCSIKASKK